MTIFLDDCTKPILDVWKGLEAASLDRVARVSTGGPGDNDPYWRMTVRDGDQAAMWLPGGQQVAGTGSERTEVGRNSLSYAPFLYKEGERRVTVVTRRLPRGYPIVAREFLTLAQWKQTGPSSLPPCLALRAWKDRWELVHTRPDGLQTLLWTGPAYIGRWDWWLLDALFSSDPQKGKVALFRNGARVMTTVTTNTLLGAPAHLRGGVYQHVSNHTTTIHMGRTTVE